MYKDLKERTFYANFAIKNAGLVLLTWGNVSLKDDKRKVVAIKPSGVSYDEMKTDDIVVVDYEGNIVEGKLRPSVDLPSHLAIYKRHPEIKSIVHTHSTFATAWAQKGRSIPLYGTTHADYFSDDVPCARYLKPEEMEKYEKNTGEVIAELIKAGHANELPGAIIKGHGAFTWGKNERDAVMHAIVLEEVAKMAYLTEAIPGENNVLPDHIKKTHYERKHGPKARYGQN